MDLRELVETIVKTLVDDYDSVKVCEVGGIQSSLIEIRVANSDIGMVIGKQGRTAAALRTILYGAGAKLNKRVILDIID